MTTHQQLTDDIRGLVQADDQRLTDEMRRLAAEYAPACRTANERLRRCMDLIGRGLRSEAIQRAEVDPPLLDLVNELDLAEWQTAWDELCSLYELPRAEPLRLELAEAIHEAYAELEPLNALLIKHRKLALAHAPLPLRIDVLRKLVAADEQSPFWEDDLRAYERARLREIGTEAREAAQSRDAGQLTSLLDEIGSPDWREKPKADLVRKVKTFAGQTRRGSARAELERIEPELQAAFSALDLSAARELRKRWNAASRRANLPDDDALAERVAPVLGWIADEDAREEQERAFQRAVADLEQAVDRDETDLTELERKAHAAVRFDRELPGSLVLAYRNRRSALEASAKRKRFAIAGSAAVALFLVIGFFGIVLWRVGLDKQIEQLAGEVTDLVEDGQLVEARRLFDEHRDISTKDTWLDVRRQLETAERSESERTAILAAAIETARASESFREAEPHLGQAREHAVSADEKLEVARLERSWQARRDEAFDSSEKEFRTAAETAAELLTKLDQSLVTARPDELETQLAQADTVVAGLLPLSMEVRPEVAREREILNARLTALRTSVTDRLDRERLLSEITAALFETEDPVEAIDHYVTAIEAYRTRFPKDPRSAEFAESIAEADVWRGVAHWEALVDGWSSDRPDDSGANDRLTAVEGFRAVYPKSPMVKLAGKYAAFLRSVVRRTDDDGITDRLLELFRAPLIGGPLHVLRSRDEKAYYLTEPADFTASTAVSFTYLIGTDPTRDTKSTTLRKTELVSPSTRPAPQVAIAEGALRDLPRMTAAQWDGYLLELCREVRSADAFDPFVRHLLLTELLAAAADGNMFLEESLTDVRSRLTDDGIDPAARWMDPDHEKARLTRQRSEAALARVTAADLETAWRVADEAETLLMTDVLQPYRLVGWLYREEGRWECQGSASPPAAVELSIAIPGSDGGTWSPGGRTSDEATLLYGDNLKQGRLLFAKGIATGDSAKSDPPQLGSSR